MNLQLLYPGRRLASQLVDLPAFCIFISKSYFHHINRSRTIAVTTLARPPVEGRQVQATFPFIPPKPSSTNDVRVWAIQTFQQRHYITSPQRTAAIPAKWRMASRTIKVFTIVSFVKEQV